MEVSAHAEKGGFALLQTKWDWSWEGRLHTSLLPITIKRWIFPVKKMER